LKYYHKRLITNANGLIFILCTFLLLSCGRDVVKVVEPKIDYVDASLFDSFREFALEKMTNNESAIEEEKTLSSKKYSDMSLSIKNINAEIETLNSKQLDGSAYINDFEQRLTILMDEYYAASKKIADKVISQSETHESKEKLLEFTAVLSGVAFWDNHYVVYMLADGQYVPLRLNDVVDDWRLTQVDYSMKQATFTHDRSQKTAVRKLP